MNMAAPAPDALTVARALRKQPSSITDDHVTTRDKSKADLARRVGLGAPITTRMPRDMRAIF